ncbi:MAG: AAA family ATPase, partial [Acidobacteriota bacterium]
MYIKRDLELVLQKNLSGPEYIAVIGARQAGKTTLLRHIQENIKDSAFLTFEDAEIRDLFDTDIKSFINLYVEPHHTIFIDEFQYAKNGGMSLKFVYDTVPGK